MFDACAGHGALSRSRVGCRGPGGTRQKVEGLPGVPDGDGGQEVRDEEERVPPAGRRRASRLHLLRELSVTFEPLTCCSWLDGDSAAT